jgi:hypothetical protein
MGNIAPTPTAPAEHSRSSSLPTLALARLMPFGNNSIPKGRVLPVGEQNQEAAAAAAVIAANQKQNEPVRGKGRV